MGDDDLLKQLYGSIGMAPHALRNRPEIARIEIHANRVLGAHLVPGLEVDARERKDGVVAKIRVLEGTVIEHPIQVCFGMIPESGVQEIELEIDVEPHSRAGVVAHCTFPNARKVRHEMDAVIRLGQDAQYAYFERHVHGPAGGVLVLPRSKVQVAQGARFQTEFELLRGRVGEIDIDLEVHGEAHSTSEINARISGTADDRIQVRETVHLEGEYARGALISHIALRDTARAEIFNTLSASAAYARGHVDCKEIVQDQAVARAVPIVEVNHPRAHVTHEAAIGSVDSRQLETLMARGLSEDEAVDLIIQGLLGGASAFAAPRDNLWTLGT
jgi:uncharacterized protein